MIFLAVLTYINNINRFPFFNINNRRLNKNKNLYMSKEQETLKPLSAQFKFKQVFGTN